MPTVLVIEDRESVRTVFTMVLQKWGYTVLTAETGELGLELAAQTRIEVACVDAGLPGMDGFAVCFELQKFARAAKRELTVWMFTGAFSEEARRRALAVGARGLWPKPFSWPELRAQLRRVAPVTLESEFTEQTSV